MSTVREFLELNRIQQMPAPGIVDTYAQETTELFDRACGTDNVLPVVIASRGEETDLPAALLSLAKSKHPVLPIVVNYPTGDKTAEYATRMGATLITNKQPGKIGALQDGVEHALGKVVSGPDRPIGFIDADVLVQTTWAGSVCSKMASAEPDKGLALFGNAVLGNGESRLTDILRSARFMAKAFRSSRLGSPPLVTGQNMAIMFGNNAAAYEAYMDIDKSLFVGDDLAIYDALCGAQMPTQQHAELGNLVLTRGDRFSSIFDLLRGRWSHKLEAYREQYGHDVTVYDRLINKEDK